MNAQEYRSAIQALGLTQGQCAKLLGIDIKTVWRYCNGYPIPKTIELAIMGLLAKARSEGWNRIDEYGATYIEVPDGGWTRV